MEKTYFNKSLGIKVVASSKEEAIKKMKITAGKVNAKLVIDTGIKKPLDTNGVEILKEVLKEMPSSKTNGVDIKSLRGKVILEIDPKKNTYFTSDLEKSLFHLAKNLKRIVKKNCSWIRNGKEVVKELSSKAKPKLVSDCYKLYDILMNRNTGKFAYASANANACGELTSVADIENKIKSIAKTYDARVVTVKLANKLGENKLMYILEFGFWGKLCIEMDLVKDYVKIYGIKKNQSIPTKCFNHICNVASAVDECACFIKCGGGKSVSCDCEEVQRISATPIEKEISIDEFTKHLKNTAKKIRSSLSMHEEEGVSCLYWIDVPNKDFIGKDGAISLKLDEKTNDITIDWWVKNDKQNPVTLKDRIEAVKYVESFINEIGNRVGRGHLITADTDDFDDADLGVNVNPKEHRNQQDKKLQLAEKIWNAREHNRVKMSEQVWKQCVAYLKQYASLYFKLKKTNINEYELLNKNYFKKKKEDKFFDRWGELKNDHKLTIRYDGEEVTFETENYADACATSLERFKELFSSGEIVTR